MNTQDQNFLTIVEQMREAQKEYFKSRDNRVLQRSIILEKLVDDAIIEYRKQTSLPCDPKPLPLFPQD